MSLCNNTFATDYQELIIGKWIQTEKTESFDLSGEKFIKSPWFVSYEFTANYKFIITTKDLIEDPYPYFIVGNKIKYIKYGIEGEMEILNLTEDSLTLKNPVSIKRFKRAE